MKIRRNAFVIAVAAAMPTQANAREQPSVTHEHGLSRAVVANGEVVIHEPTKPRNVWKSFSGTCGGDRYEISIDAGRPLADAVRSLQVNGVEHRRAAIQAITGGQTVEGRAIDAGIAECGSDAARVRFMIPSPDDLRQLRSYDLWIHADGRAEFVGER